VEITFDPAKNERNLRERNLGFAEAAECDFAPSQTGTSEDFCTFFVLVRSVVASESSAFGKQTTARHANMANRKPLTDEQGEVLELESEDFSQMIPFSALSTELRELLSSPKHVSPDADSETTKHPAA